ncbi:proline iminopeptidase [Micromonospora viridifaciens]|uniref:Proline iminopeptidase n=2 Tax=Micromonospora viridifaciens TaxID=1881 RepID=A0A1C4WT30_MICVI|nr:proline iminopeptidase [Micromonospora viridifaciens]
MEQRALSRPERSDGHQPSHVRRWGRRFLRALVYLLLVVIAILVGTQALVTVARSTTRPAAFLAAGFLAYLVVAVLGHWLLTRRVPAERRRRTRLVGAAVLAGIVLVPSLVWGLPPDGEAARTRAVAGTEQWQLPTGSRLAVLKIPAGQRTHDTPIVFLHGGPGVADMAHDAPFFGWFTSLGYDVWLYDQVGTGHSARLADPRGYSVERDTADLEAVRQRIGADRMVLIGFSYGGTLAANYLARHGEHVAKVVFTSPGRMVWQAYDTAGTGMLGRVSFRDQLRAAAAGLAPRAYLAYSLVKADPRSARAFAGDAEMDARFADLHGATAAGLVCPGHRTPATPDRLGFYANQVIDGKSATMDVRPGLRRLATPALVLKGGCDYLPWHFATDYRDAMPGTRLVYFPDAGHQLYDEQPDRYRAVVAAFLEDRPLPVTPYTGDEAPADFTGPTR